jgi:hypothetical protein
MHDGDATAHNPVEQRRFSYIWPANDGDVHRIAISEEIAKHEWSEPDWR